MNCRGIAGALLFALMLIKLNVALAQVPTFSYPAGPNNYVTGTPINPLVITSTGGPVPANYFGLTTTVAGDGKAGNRDGIGTAASLSNPVGIAIDAAGNLYVTDWKPIGIPYIYNFIKKITPAGMVTIYAGNGDQGLIDGPAATANFNVPSGLAIDVAGNLYVADVTNNVIRKITPDGIVSTFAGSGVRGNTDGIGTTATFSVPSSIAIDGSGALYVTDYSNSVIRRIAPDGTVTTYAGSGSAGYGDGPSNVATFNGPLGIAVDVSGNVYVSDAINNVIRKITSQGLVSTFAGSTVAGYADGKGVLAKFNHPAGLAVDLSGNVYVADANNNRIRRISPAGVVTTVAGSGMVGAANGIGNAASFYDPEGVTLDKQGNVYVGDKFNNLVRKIVTTGYSISPNLPLGLYFDGSSGMITGTPLVPSPLTTYTITGYNSYGSFSTTISIAVTGIEVTKTSPPAITYAAPQVYKVNLTISPLAPANTGGPVPPTIYGGTSIFAGSGIPGATDDIGQQATFFGPEGVAVDKTGNIYNADKTNNRIRKITPSGTVSTLAGNGTAGSSNGPGAAASFNQPTGVAVDAAGNVYVADAGNNQLRKIAPDGTVSTYASGFNNPAGLVVDGVGNIYLADAGANLIKKIKPDGSVTVFAGSGSPGSADGQATAASFNGPTGVAIDAAGYLYITDLGSSLIRKITPGGLVSTLAGSGSPGYTDGIGVAASFNAPAGITVDGAGNVYVGDSGNQVIRKISPDAVVTTLAGKPGSPGRSGGQGSAASFNNPRGIAIDADGNIYVADQLNNIVRQVSTTGYTISQTLPAGLSFDGKTGIISGTPTVASAATNYTVTAYNGGGSSTFVVRISVEAPVIILVPPPNISYVSPQNYLVNSPIIPLEPANPGGPVPATIYGQVSTFAGNGVKGTADGTGPAASFNTLFSIATDLVGNVYLTDNNTIRKISPSGEVSTLAGSNVAGSADGLRALAGFNQPIGIAVDGTGTVYVADTKNNTIRMITQAGQVSTLAGTAGTTGSTNGVGAAASFNSPTGITVDGNGNIYVADAGNNLVREITPAGVVSTFATGFNKPTGITIDQNNNIYVADSGNNLVKKISPAGVVNVLAGSSVAGTTDGQGTAAHFYYPTGVTADLIGNIYVADAGNNLIREISPTGLVSTFSGSGTPGSGNGAFAVASFNQPGGVAFDVTGNVYVADINNYQVRKIVATGYIINAQLPSGLTFDGKTGIITGTPTVVTPATIYTVTAYNTGGSSTAQISIAVSGDVVPLVPPPIISYGVGPQTIPVNTDITPLVPVNTGGPVTYKVFGKTITIAGSGLTGSANGPAASASFNQPFGIAVDAKGNIYVVDHLNNQIRKITTDGTVSVLAGSGTIGSTNGTGTAASFNNPTGIAIDVAGNIYVADVSNDMIRKISPTGVVTTLAGAIASGAIDGQGADARFSNPSGVAVDGAGNVYVADLSNNLIRKITPGGIVSTLAGSGLTGSADGTGTAASFKQPYGVAVDRTGNVYVSDWGNNLIRKITPDGVVTTLAGSGTDGSADGLGKDASFSKPFGIAIDAAGNLYIVDTGNEKIRKVSPTGLVSTVAGSGKRGASNGTGGEVEFYQPTGVATDGAGNVFIADEFNNLIRQTVVVSNFTIDKPLPAGLTFDPTTGTISGKPTEASAATVYTVTAYNQGGTGSTTIQIATVKAVASITLIQLLPKTYGDADFDPGATSNNSSVPIVYKSSNASVATLINGKIHITGAGTTDISASQDGDGLYSPANDVTLTLTVTPAALTITADDKTKVYGTANPIFTLSFTGFVYAEGIAQLITPPVANTTAVKNSPAGQYPITAGGAAANNYAFTYVAGTLTITPTPPVIAIPNTFTPNGDGINDVWEIQALAAFPACTVTVFNRYGSQVYHSAGYTIPWDGKYNGSRLPSGTYYYIINPGNGNDQLSGSVFILR